MISLIKLLVLLLCWAYAGSYVSDINPAACSRGSLACGTAWWMLGTVVIALTVFVRALVRMQRLRQRDQDEA